MNGEQLTATAVTRAMVQATIDYVHERRYTSADGAIGIRGRLTQPIGAFTHGGTTVRTVHCTSSLAARDALLKRVPEEWLVIVTDRSDDELGTGVLTHLVGHQLRRPDPWQTVRQRFAAQAVDSQLVARAGHRDLAFGLLEVLPGGAWPPAPSGLLTRDHAFSTLARQVLGLPDGPIDLVTVLGWSARQDATRRLREIRDTGGDSLADALVEWLASTAGTAAPAVFGLLSSGRPGDLLPLGLVINLLDDHPGQARELALARLGHHWSGIPDAAMHHLADQAPAISGSMLLDRSRHSDAERAIARADALLAEAQATHLAGSSDLLRSGLDVRLRQLGQALSGSGPETAVAVEQAWLQLNAHVLSTNNPLLSAFHGAVRLHRWLTRAATDSSDGNFAALARRQLDTDGWVDAAVNDASAGAADDQLAAALNSILTRTREVRDAHDRAFAQALADRAAEPFGTLTDRDGQTVIGLEDVLPTLVLPVAQHTPVLLLVLDGLSTGVSVELFDDLFGGDRPQWAELWFPERSHRVAGVSVLPSVTEMSRTSLLSGRLVRGTQDTERKNHAALATAHGLTSDIFHKKALDSVPEGSSLATEVRAAIDDPRRQLVTCVLNTIDDSLDRSDPAGTHWSVSAVKHLQALLDRARAAGRIVIITSDHGHVVERRLGWSRNEASTGPARHRASDNTVTEDEITVTGERVLSPDHTAVLAVSERLRYRKLSAGYHGGASPAEVIVPVVALAPTEMDPPHDLSLAVPAEPAWWTGAVRDPHETTAPAPVADERPNQPSLLDEPTESEPAFGPALVASATYADQKRLAGRVVVPDERIAALLTAMAESPQSRLTSVQTAQLLGLAPTKVTGAFEQLRRLLNVDGYPVIQRDTATGAVILDQGLAREQFGVTS